MIKNCEAMQLDEYFSNQFLHGPSVGLFPSKKKSSPNCGASKTSLHFAVLMVRFWPVMSPTFLLVTSDTLGNFIFLPGIIINIIFSSSSSNNSSNSSLLSSCLGSSGISLDCVRG